MSEGTVTRGIIGDNNRWESPWWDEKTRIVRDKLDKLFSDIEAQGLEIDAEINIGHSEVGLTECYQYNTKEVKTRHAVEKEEAEMGVQVLSDCWVDNGVTLDYVRVGNEYFYRIFDSRDETRTGYEGIWFENADTVLAWLTEKRYGLLQLQEGKGKTALLRFAEDARQKERDEDEKLREIVNSPKP